MLTWSAVSSKPVSYSSTYLSGRSHLCKVSMFSTRVNFSCNRLATDASAEQACKPVNQAKAIALASPVRLAALTLALSVSASIQSGDKSQTSAEICPSQHVVLYNTSSPPIHYRPTNPIPSPNLPFASLTQQCLRHPGKRE